MDDYLIVGRYMCVGRVKGLMVRVTERVVMRAQEKWIWKVKRHEWDCDGERQINR